jgi:hypothetical protein
LGISEEDADLLAMSEGMLARVEIAGAAESLPVRIVADLPRGLALIPKGLVGLKGLAIPVRVRLTNVVTAEKS